MCFRKSRSEGGLKNDPIRRGGVDFFWNNPLRLFSKNFTVCIDLCSKIIRSSENYTTIRIDIAFASLVAPKRAVFVHIKHKLTFNLVR